LFGGVSVGAAPEAGSRFGAAGDFSSGGLRILCVGPLATSPDWEVFAETGDGVLGVEVSADGPDAGVPGVVDGPVTRWVNVAC
jgi:hypothetical protein